MIAVVLEAFGFEKRDGGELAPVSFLAWDLRQRRSKFAAPAIVAAPKGSHCDRFVKSAEPREATRFSVFQRDPKK